MATGIRTRLGDILLRTQKLKPHQLGVALDVQRRTGLPLGQILLGAHLITRTQLGLALLHQRMMRTKLGQRCGRKASPSSIGSLAATGQELLEKHWQRVKESPTRQQGSETVSHHEEALRRERAGLPPGRVARLVESDDALAARLRSGNF